MLGHSRSPRLGAEETGYRFGLADIAFQRFIPAAGATAFLSILTRTLNFAARAGENRQ